MKALTRLTLHFDRIQRERRKNLQACLWFDWILKRKRIEFRFQFSTFPQKLTLNVVLNHCSDFVSWLRKFKCGILRRRSSQVSSVVLQNLIAHSQANVIGDRIFLYAVYKNAVSVSAQQTNSQVWIFSVKLRRDVIKNLMKNCKNLSPTLKILKNFSLQNFQKITKFSKCL